ncbi:MAG: FHA domain-containing protein, partial [Dehalococcoidia bacterium]|nr:FHA domain-containing protein [Dehalococcoidia bacterium]
MKFGTLRITTVDGRQREYPLDLPSIVIGRADGNAIVIDDLSVARRHARAFFDSGRLMLEDLGSAEGTYIDGQRLTPGTPGLVEPASEIRFGDVSARYEPPAEPEEPEYEHETTAPALPAVPPATGIGVRLAVGNEPLLPGSGGLTAEITVHNRGNVVDEFDIAVTGLSPSWLILSTPRVGLLPGAETTVLLTIQPPRHSDAVAGDHPFDVTITSETTGQSATESGTLRILGFNGLVLTIEPPRGRRDFVLVAGNDGNVTETLALSGVDDEDAFDYTFRQDVLVVPPGREERLPFRVKPRKRALFGRETIVPFNVVAKPETGEVEAIPAAGQLVVHPPLEPLKRPVLFSLVLIVLGIATFGVFLFSNDSGTKAASPEAAYAGVHMCDKGNQPKNAQAPVSNANKASAVLGTTSDAIPAVAQTGPVIQQQQGDSGGPYFAQNDPRWANVEYAKAGDPDFGPDWCGTTIAQCGCAMTSVTTIMALFNIITMPDGEPLTPKTVNDWFNLNARKTVRGWVSQGYIYGDVIWTAVNQLSGEIAAKYPGTRTLRFARTGTGSDAEIKAELRAGRPIVLEVPGHWIAAVGLDGDTILINDPFYRDRKTLDAYAGKVKSSVLFEPSNDLSAVVITVPADTRIRVTDKQGRVVGTLDTTSAQDAAKNAKTEIPGASYSTRQAWRDPTCVESAPPVGAGTNQIVLPGSRDDYKIEVLETTGGPTSVSIHTYDKNGQPTVQTIDNDTGGVTASMSFDPTKGKADVSIVGGKPVEEDSSARSAGKTAQAQAASPSPSPSPSATASATPSAGPGGLTTTTLSVSVPAGTKEIAVSSQNGFSIGDLIRISPGQANEEDATIAAFGSFILTTPLKFAHSAGEPVVRLGGAPPGTGGAGGTPGGSQGPPKTEVVPPDSVALTCSVVYSDSPRTATLVCSAAIGGVFTTTRWTVDGSVRAEISGKTVFLATYTHDGLTSISVSACNQTLCKSDSTTQTIRFPAAPGQPTPTVAPPPPTPVVPTVTPPAVGAALNCGYLIDTTTVAGGQAQVTCLAQTKESLTSFTFQTEDITPGSTTLVSASSTDASGARTYKFDGTAAPNDLTPTNQQATVTVGGEACTLSSCSTVSPAMLTIPYANVSLSVLPATVPLGTSVNLFAVITGPNGLVPAGGTVQFAAIDTSGSTPVTVPIGLEVKVSPVGGFAVANLTVPTGQMPLSNTQAYKIIAVY